MRICPHLSGNCLQDTDDDEHEMLPVAASAPDAAESITKKPEVFDLPANDIVDGYETLETKKLSNNQLKRIILLEQFKIVKLKRMKMERGVKATVANDGNDIEIEYIGFNETANDTTEPNVL